MRKPPKFQLGQEVIAEHKLGIITARKTIDCGDGWEYRVAFLEGFNPLFPVLWFESHELKAQKKERR